MITILSLLTPKVVPFWSVIGSGIDAVAGLGSAYMTNKASRKEAAANRAHQIHTMKHRHQWEVGDLRKAGLNPILSAGGAPPIGPGAQANMAKPDIKPSSAYMELKLKRDQSALLKEQRIKAQEEGRNASMQANRTYQDIIKNQPVVDEWLKRGTFYAPMKALHESTGDSTASSARGLWRFFKKGK